MIKSDVIEFFDKLAGEWDRNMIKDDEIINTILDNAEVKEELDILDVACGTGVMIPYYLERKVNSVTAIDISSEMAEIAKRKFQNDKVTIICADVEEMDWNAKFDCIMVYNAFPHFPDPQKLVRCLSGMLKSNGCLVVAHGQSREEIDNHHKGNASKVSVGLMDENELAEIFGGFLKVTCKISNEKMYQVIGRKI